MISLLQPKILTVGLQGKNQMLEELPIHLIKCIGGKEASAYLKREKVDSVVTMWSLADMTDGMFVRRLRAVKHDVPCIVIVNSEDREQEIYARSYGASVVLTDKTSDDFFKRVIVEIMRLQEACSVREDSDVTESRISSEAGYKGR